MSNEFPKMLYRCPGPIVWDGIKHEQCIVSNADAEAAAVVEGWHADIAAAQAAHAEAHTPAAVVATPEPAPPEPAPVDPVPVDTVAEEAALEPAAPVGKKKG